MRISNRFLSKSIVAIAESVEPKLLTFDLFIEHLRLGTSATILFTKTARHIFEVGFETGC